MPAPSVSAVFWPSPSWPSPSWPSLSLILPLLLLAHSRSGSASTIVGNPGFVLIHEQAGVPAMIMSARWRGCDGLRSVYQPLGLPLEGAGALALGAPAGVWCSVELGVLAEDELGLVDVELLAPWSAGESRVVLQLHLDVESGVGWAERVAVERSGL